MKSNLSWLGSLSGVDSPVSVNGSLRVFDVISCGETSERFFVPSFSETHD